jgi:hypothetical protein
MGGRKSDKRYTNEAWSKRVDHEAGLHRAPRALKEPARCEVCGDVYADRRWTKPDAERKETQHPHHRPPLITVCPACKRAREEVPSGFLHLDGVYLTAHSQEIEHLLRNEAERAAEDNPLARIMNWGKDERGRLTLSTTTEHLAQRLGHALEKAFSGEARYDFSHENKLAHVYWHRD